MAEIEVVRGSALPPAEAWARLTDWRRHADVVPLTTMTVSGPDRPGVGTRFVARTGVGPLAFDDPMEVTRWEPPADGAPGHCRVEKQGSVIVGWMELTVSPDGHGGSLVVWREDAGPGVGHRVLSRPNEVAGRWLFSRLVDRLLASP